MKKRFKKLLAGLSLLEVVVASSVLFTGASASMGLFAMGCRIPDKAEEASLTTSHCEHILETVLSEMDADLQPPAPTFDKDHVLDLTKSQYNFSSFKDLPADPQRFEYRVKSVAGTVADGLNGMAVVTVDVRGKKPGSNSFTLAGARRIRYEAPMKPPPPKPAGFDGGATWDIAKITRGSQLVKEVGCLSCHDGSVSQPWVYSDLQWAASGVGTPQPFLQALAVAAQGATPPPTRWFPADPPMTVKAYIEKVVTTSTGPGAGSMAVQCTNPADAADIAEYVALLSTGTNPDLFVRTLTP